MKNVVITGASSGLGYALSLAFAMESGCRVLATSRNGTKLGVLVEESKEHGKGEIVVMDGDLKEGVFIEELADTIKREMGEIDILINNAGILYNRPFMEMSNEEVREQFEVNFFAPLNLLRSMIPYIRKGGGHVINIGSMGGYQGSVKFPGLSVYSSSKAALSCLTECLAAEYASTGVRFNALALGAVQTEMLSEAFPGYRAPVDATEMAAAIKAFAESMGKVINGRVVPLTLGDPVD